MTSRLVLLAMVAAIAGCATPSESPSGQPAPFTAIERGQALAERRCGGCHAVGPIGESAQTMAPPFRDLGLRYNAISFERRMAGQTSRGHHEMPPLRLERSEVRDLAAYIDSLDDH